MSAAFLVVNNAMTSARILYSDVPQVSLVTTFFLFFFLFFFANLIHLEFECSLERFPMTAFVGLRKPGLSLS